MDLDEHRNRLSRVRVDLDRQVRSLASIRAEDAAESGPCVMDRAEPQLRLRPLLGNFDDVRVEADAGREQRVLGARSGLAVALHEYCSGRGGFRLQQCFGRRNRVPLRAVQPRHHVGGPHRDDAESRLGADQTVADVVDDSVASHRHNGADAPIGGLDGAFPGLGGVRRPHRQHLEAAAERCNDVAKQRPGEPGR